MKNRSKTVLAKRLKERKRKEIIRKCCSFSGGLNAEYPGVYFFFQIAKAISTYQPDRSPEFIEE
jgi:hypothetical protein